MSELALYNDDDSDDLPSQCMSFAGYQFQPRDLKWRLVDASRRETFDFQWFTPLISTDLLSSFRRTFLEYVQGVSLSHCSNCFRYFKRFVESASACNAKGSPISSICASDLLNFLAQLRSKPNDNSEYWFGVLSGFLKKWQELGYRGVDTESYVLLGDLRLKGNRKGEAVLTMDKEKGPFTALELQSIHSEIQNTFAKGETSLRQFVIVWLFIATGARALQLTLLKVRDLKVSTASDGTRSYILSIPCAKARGRRHRETFTDRPIISELGRMVEHLIGEVTRECNRGSRNSEALDLPIFPSWGADAPIGFDDHGTSGDLRLELESILETLPTSSERTGERIKATSRRFRYTLGTRAAREGHGKYVIAALLDHTDTQNVDVYTQTTAEAIERIDKAVAFQLAPLAQAFAGMIVTDETAADRGNDPTSRISDPRLGGGSGTCGKHGFCSALAPIACYTCRNFQPWLDGPHERMLDHLIAERERILELTGDQNVASAHDRTILAAAEVVRRCKIIKEETAN